MDYTSEIIVIIIVLFIYIGTPLIAYKKGRSPLLWFIATLFLPFIALIAILCLHREKRCPYCKQRIHIDSSKCRYCQSDL